MAGLFRTLWVPKIIVPQSMSQNKIFIPIQTIMNKEWIMVWACPIVSPRRTQRKPSTFSVNSVFSPGTTPPGLVCGEKKHGPFF